MLVEYLMLRQLVDCSMLWLLLRVRLGNRLKSLEFVWGLLLLPHSPCLLVLNRLMSIMNLLGLFSFHWQCLRHTDMILVNHWCISSFFLECVPEMLLLLHHILLELMV